MDERKIDAWVMENKKYFPEERMVFIREKLRAMDEQKFSLVIGMSYKDPTVFLIVSIFLGGLGVDRFMLGSVGMGILKLLTAGCCGVLWLIDLFTIQKKVREKNFNELMSLI